MQQLATVFNSLRQQDGEPDARARQLALDSLIPYLSLQEIRRLRVQLSSRPICDFCDLPLELIIRIFAQLPLEDVLVLRRVSHKWNNILSSADFCHGMTKVHFRSHWVHVNKQTEENQGEKHEESMKQYFQERSIARIRRSHGYYNSMAIYWHHMSPGEDGYEPHFCAQSQYSNGRIGVKFNSNTILVKSLRSNSEACMYIDENRQPFEKWLLSDRYLICLKASPTKLFAWDLESPDDALPHRVRLPSRVLNFSASQDRVAIVTTGYQVLIWKIGGALDSLDVSKARKYLQFTTTHLFVLWDSVDYNHFFAVYEGVLDDKVIFAIIEFSPTLQKTHMIEFLEASKEDRRPPRMAMLEAGIIGISNLAGLSKLNGQQEPNTNATSLGPEKMEMLTFNSYTGAFKINSYFIPDYVGADLKNCWQYMTSQLHFWRDQILVPMYGSHLDFDENAQASNTGKVNNPPLLMSLSASLEPQGRTEIPCYSSYEKSDGKIIKMMENKSKEIRSSVAYFWEAGARFAHAQKPRRGENSVNYSRNVMGDDDFVVLSGHYGFIVWCFSGEIKLPTAFRWNETDVPLWNESNACTTIRSFHPLA